MSCHHCPQDQSTNQSTDMRGIIDRRNYCPKKQIVSSKHYQASQSRFNCSRWHREMPEVQRSDQCSSHSENCTRGSGPEAVGMKSKTSEAAGNSAKGIR